MLSSRLRLALLSENFSKKCCVRTYCLQNVDQDAKDSSEDEEFRVLNLRKHPPVNLAGQRKKQMSKHTVTTEMLPPRSTRMAIDQDWSNVWPSARTFHPATIPLPVRQGYVKPNKGRIVPGKFANAELMKIPNFFHLAPPTIKKHCETLKQYCTQWPAELQTDDDCDEHFPVEIITSDYLHSTPSIRDPRARIVSLIIKLSALNLNYHARDKFKRLVGERYYEKKDTVTMVADRCPMRGQNYDYLKYLLNVLFTESWKYEDWETEKTEDDDECFFWDRSSHKKRILELVKKLKQTTPEQGYLQNIASDPNDQDIAANDFVKDYSVKLTEIIDNGDSVESLNEYKESVKKLLGLRAS